jgi:hypothetical protein
MEHLSAILSAVAAAKSEAVAAAEASSATTDLSVISSAIA